VVLSWRISNKLHKTYFAKAMFEADVLAAEPMLGDDTSV